jgi:monofunctional biosynthetic peptidoglycan transglycosylase
MGKTKKHRSFWGRTWRLLFVKIPVIFVAVTVLWVLLLRWGPVMVTPLMIHRSVQYIGDPDFHTHKKWRSYDRISYELARAVMASEDNKFNDHNGFDWEAIDKAMQNNARGRRIKGGSTISQQTAKNVFLPPSRTYVRKAFEAYFTVLIETFWTKRRIMEVYLNVIEFGKGIYGAESAAEILFHTTAGKLSRRQSCLLAACLPSPLKRHADNPSGYVSAHASNISAIEDKLIYPAWVYHKKATRQTPPSYSKTTDKRSKARIVKKIKRKLAN